MGGKREWSQRGRRATCLLESNTSIIQNFNRLPVCSPSRCACLRRRTRTHPPLPPPAPAGEARKQTPVLFLTGQEKKMFNDVCPCVLALSNLFSANALCSRRSFGRKKTDAIQCSLCRRLSFGRRWRSIPPPRSRSKSPPPPFYLQAAPHFFNRLPAPLSV